MPDAKRSVADSTALALAIVLAFGAIYALLARFAFDRFPFSAEEYSLSLQAELFARGLVKVPGPAHAEWLHIDHVVFGDFVRSAYPPGAPLLVSLGTRCGAAWLVGPLEGMIALGVTWHTVRRLLDRRAGLIALVLLGAAPLFAFDAASFYMHAPALLCIAIAFAALAQWVRCECWPWLVVTGVMLGCMFLVRPLDAIVVGAALAVFRSPRVTLIATASALPFVIAGVGYGNAMYELSLAALWTPTQWWSRLAMCAQLCLQWTVPGSVIAALFGGYAIDRDHPARAMRDFSLAVIVLALAALGMTNVEADDGPQARYLSVTLIPLALLAAAGYRPLCAAITARFGRRVRILVFATAAAFAVVQLGAYVQDRAPKLAAREGLYELTRDLPSNAIVIVRAEHPSRLARNGPSFDGVLYLSVSPTTTPIAIAAAYPDRPIWDAREGVPWTLVRVR